MRKVLLRLLVLIVAVVLAATCGGSGSNPPEPFGDDLPSDFPQSFPVYPEAELQSSGQVAHRGSLVFGVTWETPDSIAQVVAFYEGRFRELDWTVSTSRYTGNGALLRFAGSEGALGGELSVVDNGDGTQITAFFSGP